MKQKSIFGVDLRSDCEYVNYLLTAIFMPKDLYVCYNNSDM